jgi:hypothetical protein
LVSMMSRQERDRVTSLISAGSKAERKGSPSPLAWLLGSQPRRPPCPGGYPVATRGYPL